MAQTLERQTGDGSNEQNGPDIYLPAMSPLSTEPGRVERFITNLLRRRGEFRTVVRSRNR
jgi:hypothetical protein